jgi:uncharacterized protein (TIGR02271 family)
MATRNTRTQPYAGQIESGWDVYGSDGEKIGDVADVGTDYFIVEKGFIFPTELYVPMSAVQSVERDRVDLSFTKDQIESQGWDRPPATMSGTTHDEAISGYTARGQGATLERREEQLRVDKEPVRAGEVRVGKDVIEQEQSVDVPVSREDVQIDRRAVDRPASAEEFSDQEVSIPVTEERARVTKDARVVEELDVDKDVHEDTERVTDTVKKEQFRVEGEDHPRMDR